MVQLPAGARLPMQLLVCWNGAVGMIRVTLMAAALLFVIVTGIEPLSVFTTWLLNTNFAADKFTPVPVPVREIVCVPTLLVRVIEPVRVPNAVGVNLKLIVQKCPGVTPGPVQLLVSLKSPEAATLVNTAVLVD